MGTSPGRTEGTRGLTLADLERARLATGVTLEQVAQRSRIPEHLLRQLESGRLTEWPAGRYGRTQLVRYARAATLDPEAVVAAVQPLLPASSDVGQAIALDPGPPSAPAETGAPDAEVRQAPSSIAIVAADFSPDEELFASEEAPARPGAPSSQTAPAPLPGQAAVAPESRHPREPPVAAAPVALVSDVSEVPTARSQPGAVGAAPTPVLRETAAAPASEVAGRPPRRARSVEAVHASAAERTSRMVAAPPLPPAPARGRRLRGPLAAAAVLFLGVGVWLAFLARPDRSSWTAPAAQSTLARSAPAVDGPSPVPAPESPSTAPAPAETSGPQFTVTAHVPDRDAGTAEPGTTAGARRADGLGTTGPVYSPAFSPTGNAMFYHEQSGTRSALLRADTDANGAVLRVTRVLDDNAQNFHVRPAPDGETIAFDSDRDGTRGVYLADADGQRVRRVSGEGYAAVPSWSPDGRHLAFVKAEARRPRLWNLWQLTVETGELRRLTSHTFGQPWGGSWFPDGKRIAYSHEESLVVLDLARGTRRVYRSPRPGRLLRTPAVSPDGERIMFQVARDGAWLMDVSSGEMRKVLDDASAEEYTWSPDGRRLAYHSRRSGQWGVWTMTAP